jgi:Phospholipase C
MSRESKVLTVLGVIIVVVIVGGILVMHARSGHQLSSNGAPVPANNQGIHKIQHVIVIMQENRSFDSYLALSRSGRFSDEKWADRCLYP